MDKSKATVVGYLYDVRSFMIYVYTFAIINLILLFFWVIFEAPKIFVYFSLISSFIILFVIPYLIKNYRVNGKIRFCNEKIDLIYDDGSSKSYALANMDNLVVNYSNYWFQSEFSMGYGFHIFDGTGNSVSFNYNGKTVDIMFQVRNRQFFRDVYDLWKHRDSPLIKLIHNNKSPVVKWTNKKSNNEKN